MSFHNHKNKGREKMTFNTNKENGFNYFPFSFKYSNQNIPN